MERQRKMHDGELEVQKRKGVEAEASDINEIGILLLFYQPSLILIHKKKSKNSVVDFISHQWPPFLRMQRFVFVASREPDGTIWTSALFGKVIRPIKSKVHISNNFFQAIEDLFRFPMSERFTLLQFQTLSILFINVSHRKKMLRLHFL